MWRGDKVGAEDNHATRRVEQEREMYYWLLYNKKTKKHQNLKWEFERITYKTYKHALTQRKVYMYRASHQQSKYPTPSMNS